MAVVQLRSDPAHSPDLATPAAPAGVARSSARSGGGRMRRLWAAPLAVHALVLLGLLVAAAAVIGVGTSWTSDEGAAILQVHALVVHHSWVVPDPLSKLGAHDYPIALSDHGAAGYAPYGKHLAYIVALAAADEIAGVAGMVGLSILAGAVAALLAAKLSAEIRPGLERVTLWTVGLGSPLAFDSLVVMGHSLAAALVAGAVLAVLRFLRAPGRKGTAALVGMAGCLVVAALVRNEAVLFCGGLGVGSALLAAYSWRRNRVAEDAGRTPGTTWRRGPLELPPAGRALAVAGGAVLAGILAHELDPLLTRAAIGRPVTAPGGAAVTTGGGGLLVAVLGRLHGLVQTWLMPSYNFDHRVSGILVLTLMAGAAGALWARRRPHDPKMVVVLSAVGVAAVLARLIGDPSGDVPGLAMAFPVLWVGMWLWRRDLLDQVPGFLLTVSAGLFALAVAALQYSIGGGAEWGGRYFALGLPLFVPVALEAIRRSGAGLRRPVQSVAVASMVAVSVAMAAMGIAQLRFVHQATAQALTATTRAGGQAEPAGGGRPVIVTTLGLLPRLAWAHYDQQRWLLVAPGLLSSYGPRLQRLGVARLVLVTNFRSHDLAALAASYRLVSVQTPPLLGWTVAVLQARAPVGPATTPQAVAIDRRQS